MSAKTESESVRLAKEVIQTEADAVRALADRLDERFDQAVKLLLECKGKAITTGIGKSAAIARKLAGILSSTGTPALYLNPADGVHGDLGVVTPADVVILLSYSGESDEIVNVLPVIKRIGARCIGFTRAKESSLSRRVDVALDVTVEREACPLGLAPTSSTTAMLALGDALALSVMQARRFTKRDFAKFHPAGALGRRLILTAKDLMRSGADMAICTAEQPLKDVLFAITKAGAGAACMVDAEGKFMGILTDGDVRRHLLADGSLSVAASQVMTRKATCVSPESLAVEGLRIMEERKIGDLPVLDADGRPVGVLMLKDVTKAGLV